MDTASNNRTGLQGLGAPQAARGQTPRQAPRLDLASWVAIAAFVAYIGVGILA